MKKRYAIDHKISAEKIMNTKLSYEEIDEIMEREIAIKAMKEIPIELLRKMFQFTKHSFPEYSRNGSPIDIKSNLREYFTHSLRPQSITYRGIITIETDE